ncbi:MAG TPA: DivIVA domain-containing protein [Acidimicrobiales bacterium]|nr:DivIVA domain-containing protein [Acidimicrobiales bacterium]
MELTSSDRVREAEFAVKMRGYDSEQVDAFLDDLAAGVDGLLARLRQTEDALRTARAGAPAPTEGSGPAVTSDVVVGEGVVGRALVVAQRAAEQVLQDAHAEARAVREDAEADAERVRSSAAGEAAALVQELDRRRRDLEQQLADLTYWVEQRRNSLSDALSGALRGLDDWLDRSTTPGPAEPASPAPASHRA